MEYLITFGIILIFSIILTLIFRKRIEEVFPIGIIEICLIIFIAGLFDRLSIGITLIKILSIMQLVIFLIILLRKKSNEEVKEIIKNILTPGLFVYISLFFTSIIINKNRIMQDYDEFNHWGVIIKNMFLYNCFGTNEQSVVRFNEYPPFTAVFQYLFLGISKVYREDIIITAQNILYFSIILPILKNIRWNKSLINLFITIPIIIFTPMIFYENFYLDILVDGILGIMFAYVIYSALEQEENLVFKFLRLLAGTIMLCLTKTTGIVLAGLAILIILIKNIIDIKHKKEFAKQQIKFIVLMAIIASIITSMWYIKVNNTQKRWDFTQMVEVDSQQVIDKLAITKSFISKTFFEQEITAKNFTVFIVILLIISLQCYATTIVKDKEYKYYAIAMFWSILIWLIGLLITYATIFDPAEAYYLTCFDRYTSTILFANVMFIVLTIEMQKEKRTLKEGIVIISIIIALLPLANIIKKYVNGESYIVTSNINRGIYTQLKNYKEKLTVNDKILFIVNSKDNDEYIKSMNEYEIMPLRINRIQKANFNSIEDFEKSIKGYTHVFIYQMENSKIEIVKDIFKDNIVEPYTLYKVNEENNKIILEME